MIDMVFILLIFFIVTTVFVEETVEVNKPEAAAATTGKERILIAVTSDNKVAHGGRDIGISGVAPIVKRLTCRKTCPAPPGRRRRQPRLRPRLRRSQAPGAKAINFSTKR